MWTWESSETPEYSELDCRGQNTSPWGVIYTSGKVSKSRCQKMALHEPFKHFQHKLWSKEGRGVKLAFWLLTTKSQESTRPRCVQVECNTLLERSWGELQVFLRHHPNQRSELGVMSSQSPKSPNWDNFGTPPWESRDKKPFGCGCRRQTHIILYGGKCWLPPSLGHGESCESRVARGLS